MTIQEEIRERIADFLWEVYKRRIWIYRHPDREEFLKVTATNELIDSLHSQGVVIKVERDLVNTDSETEHIKTIFAKWLMSYADNKTTLLEVMRGISEAGYVAVEPLEVMDERC